MVQFHHNLHGGSVLFWTMFKTVHRRRTCCLSHFLPPTMETMWGYATHAVLSLLKAITIICNQNKCIGCNICSYVCTRTKEHPTRAVAEVHLNYLLHWRSLLLCPSCPVLFTQHTVCLCAWQCTGVHKLTINFVEVRVNVSIVKQFIDNETDEGNRDVCVRFVFWCLLIC